MRSIVSAFPPGELVNRVTGLALRFASTDFTGYAELAKRLKKHGLKETEASITNKLARDTFPATFFRA